MSENDINSKIDELLFNIESVQRDIWWDSTSIFTIFTFISQMLLVLIGAIILLLITTLIADFNTFNFYISIFFIVFFLFVFYLHKTVKELIGQKYYYDNDLRRMKKVIKKLIKDMNNDNLF
ncbi:MAG: hypothetical protein ACFFD1_06650 [Candidatus Thorarchaeota archaeon]